jgi:hypothetical protein
MGNKTAHVKGVMNVRDNFKLPEKKKFNGIGNLLLYIVK